MVEVGSLEWTVEAVGAAEAKRDAEKAAEGVKDTADQAKEADSAVSGLTGVLETAATGMLVMGGNSAVLRAAVLALNGDVRKLAVRLTGMTGVYRRLVSVKGAAVAASERLTSAIQFLRGGITLLRSAVSGLLSGGAARLASLIGSVLVPAALRAAGGIGGLATAIRGLGAAAKAGAVANLGRLAAALGGISGASIAGAAALGGLIGLLGVGVLEVTGFLDKTRELGKETGERLPASIRDGLIVAIGSIAGPLAASGAAISGFVSGYLDGGLSEGIARAKGNWSQAMGVFAGAWNRTEARLANGIASAQRRFNGFVSAQRRGFQTWKQDTVRAAAAWKNGVLASVRTGVGGMLDAGRAYVDGFVSGIRDRIPNAAEAASALSGTIRSYLPSSPAERGPLSDLDKVGPGMVAEISRTVEASVPRAESASRSLASAVAPSSPPAPRYEGGSGGGGDGSGGVTVIVENQRIEIGDQSLDASSLGRREMEQLAGMISDKQGKELRRIISN